MGDGLAVRLDHNIEIDAGLANHYGQMTDRPMDRFLASRHELAISHFLLANFLPNKALFYHPNPLLFNWWAI